MNSWIEKIRPAVDGWSDKFSWSLFQILRNHPGARIFWLSRSEWDNRRISYAEKNSVPNLMQHFIVGWKQDNSLFGSSLFGIMIKDKPVFMDLASIQPYLEDATTSFMEEYHREGRCLFDRGHAQWWSNDETRLTVLPNKNRRCNWCGKILTPLSESPEIARWAPSLPLGEVVSDGI